MGGCSLYEKGVYQTLCLLLFVISQITHNCKRTKTTVNVHGWYIITSRGLSYICDIPRKEQYIPIAWASALSVSTIRAMREPRAVGWMTGKIPTLSFCICSILSLTNPILGNLSENEFEGIVLNNIEQVNGKVVLSINVVF